LLQAICRQDAAPAPFTLVIQAHPDDEVIGLGAHLTRLNQASILHVTDGAPHDGHDATANGFAGAHEYSRARRAELEEAVAMAGIAPSQLAELACPDQHASHCMVDLARQIARIIDQFQPELVITHPYEGGHPDHDATALAVHAACRMLSNRGLAPPPLAETSSYHVGPQGIQPYHFLPANSGESPGDALVVTLTRQQRELKQRMLACFTTQAETLRWFPVAVECFRPAPRYDFARPPHPGRLFYEMFSWGMTGDRFCELAQQACRLLDVEEVL
jgi:LmbE family N-acetylglucosaminyl deacetylase